jgi:hypothetical protein
MGFLDKLLGREKKPAAEATPSAPVATAEPAHDHAHDEGEPHSHEEEQEQTPPA